MSEKYFCRECKAMVGAEQFLSDDLPECNECYGTDVVPPEHMTDEDKSELAEAQGNG